MQVRTRRAGLAYFERPQFAIGDEIHWIGGGCRGCAKYGSGQEEESDGFNRKDHHAPHILYIPTHQHPLDRGTGGISEAGDGAARGTTVNIPLPGGCGDDEYEQVFTQIIVPAAERFNPQLIMVSAGYDLHWADELALMQVSVSGFARMIEIIRGLADELCDGRLVLSLEGVYHLDALAASVKATFDMLLGQASVHDPPGRPSPRFATPRPTQPTPAAKEMHTLS